MAIGNPFKMPGDEDLKKMGKSSWPDSSGSKGPQDSTLTSGGGGGFGKAARDTVEARQRAAADKQAEGEPPPEVDTYGKAEPSDSTKKESEAVLSEPKWTKTDTLFQQEAEVSVKVALPEGKEHMTRVQAELFAKTPNGRESIANSEGHADSTGRATIVLPVYKPKGYTQGAVEYFIEFAHKLAKVLSTENLLRKVSETALKSADHVLVPGITFAKDSSFIQPHAAEGFRNVESKLKEWDEEDRKKAKIVVFGHADKDEKDAKALSERRAHSAYAFITNDADTWDKLYAVEKWGLASLQSLLRDLGHYQGTPDGTEGPKTQTAFKTIQQKNDLPTTGKEDAATRKAIFTAYMKGKHDIKIESKRFRTVAGNSWMGCASNNRTKVDDSPSTENRRVAFILIKESKFFPVHFPCQDGSEAACQAQCKKAGKRSGPGIGCAFYDELVREECQTTTNESQQEEKQNGDTSSVKNYSIEKAITHLNAHAHQESIHECATYVREAIQAGGGVLPTKLSHHYAKEYGPVLSAMGFHKVPIADYSPQKGDIAVFQPPKGKVPGHVQMYNGSEWVSDFFQGDSPDIYPGSAYRSEKVEYEIYRP